MRARIPNPATGELRDMVVRISSPAAAACSSLSAQRTICNPQTARRIRSESRSHAPARADLSIRDHQDAHARPEDARGEFPPGDFVEYDLDAEGRLVPVDRPYGKTKPTSSLESSATSPPDIPRA